MIKHFLSISDLGKKEIKEIFSRALKLKKELKTKGKNRPLLKDKTLVMIFEKPSLRTRVSFEVGMTQLGGHAIYLGPSDIQMGKRESIPDIAKNLSRMADFIMARVFNHEVLIELAENSSIPVINGLSDLEHPCQALADLLTVYEHKKKWKGLKLAYVGDGENNVAHSLALLCSTLEVEFTCGAPKSYWIKKEIVKKLKRKILQTEDLYKAVKNADVVVTDTWVSMGDEEEKEKRLKIFPLYQVNKKLMSYAKKKAIFLHCLPAYRGYEVTSEIIDGSESVVFQEAENRLHVQKALLVWLAEKDELRA